MHISFMHENNTFIADGKDRYLNCSSIAHAIQYHFVRRNKRAITIKKINRYEGDTYVKAQGQHWCYTSVTAPVPSTASISFVS